MERDVRIPLEKGTQLTINGSVFTISDIIGRGGLSLVYSATKEGGMTESVIKEFYPAPDSRGRIYADRDEYGYVHCIDDIFEKQYNDMLRLFEAEGPIGGDTASISFQILPFWEYHDGYAVMKKESADMRSLKTLVDEWEQNAPLPPSGKPRENDPVFNNMVRLNYALNIVDSLLSALSAVHEKYIHLDLSSSNVIWACREQTGRNGCAIITDFGSAAVLDKCGEFRPNYKLFCSLGFAAPEVFVPKPVFTRKTDLYSVGMLLIYLCIGERQFMRYFSKIKRPERLGRDIASIDLQLPKETGSRLNTFLQTALVERKYNTVQKMQAGLRRVRESTQFYLTDNESAVIPIGDKIQGGIDDKHYIERKEIKDIEVLLNSNQIPFVTGIGGIGKTTLVRRFAKEYADKYFVSFVTYAGSIRNTIAELGARNCDENEWAKMTPDKRFSAGLALLKSSTSNHVLIIDNADSGNEDLRSDPDFHYLQEVPTHIIFTTRNEMEGAGIIHLDRMSDSDCLKLMKSYLPEYMNGQYDGTLLDIIDTVDGHTLICSLLALTLRDSFKLKPADVLAALKKSKLDDKRWHKVKSEYNLDFIPRTVLAHLQTAFNLSELSDEIKKILGCFCLAEYGLTKEYIELLFTDEEWDAILAAENGGWLMCRDESKNCKESIPRCDSRMLYMLHPVIRAVCLLDEQTAPRWSLTSNFIMEHAANLYSSLCIEKEKLALTCNIIRMKDFLDTIKIEPDCACILYMHVLWGYDCHEDAHLKSALRTLMPTDDYSYQHFSESSDDCLKMPKTPWRDLKLRLERSREKRGLIIKKYALDALLCVKRCSPIYPWLICNLRAVCFSESRSNPYPNVRLDKAELHWFLLGNPYQTSFSRRCIEKKYFHDNAFDETIRSMRREYAERIESTRLEKEIERYVHSELADGYCLLGDVENELYHARKAYECSVQNQGPIGSLRGDAEQYIRALIHTHNYQDALIILNGIIDRWNDYLEQNNLFERVPEEFNNIWDCSFEDALKTFKHQVFLFFEILENRVVFSEIKYWVSVFSDYACVEAYKKEHDTYITQLCDFPGTLMKSVPACYEFAHDLDIKVWPRQWDLFDAFRLMPHIIDERLMDGFAEQDQFYRDFTTVFTSN